MSWSLPRCIISAFALIVALPFQAAHAETYPARPITILVSLAAGTRMDTLVRIYADKLSQALGPPVVIENKPGGAGRVARETIAQGPPRRPTPPPPPPP